MSSITIDKIKNEIPKMILARNARTFERLKKMILKGAYDKEELIMDMTDFLEMGTLTQKEFDDLLALIEEHPQARAYAMIDENGVMISDNTFLLLKKQIVKKVYSIDTIEQMVTDFKITGTIDRDQFKALLVLIDEIYFPVVDEIEEEPIL